MFPMYTRTQCQKGDHKDIKLKLEKLRSVDRIKTVIGTSYL